MDEVQERKKLYRRQYYLAHREKEKANQKKNYWIDPGKARSRVFIYRTENPEKIKNIKKKSCVKHKEKIKDYNKKYYDNNAQAIRTRSAQRKRKRLYGLSEADFNKLIAEYKNRCGICGNKFTEKRSMRPQVDHDHSSGKIRGVLCSLCNRGLGFFEDSPVRIANAIKWVSNV